MTDPSQRFRARLEKLKATMSAALVYGANEYANGNGRAKPIVDAHFTAGNAERYAWPPLSEAYFKAKAAGITKHAGGAYYLNPAERAQAAQRRTAEKSGNAALGNHYQTGGRRGYLTGKLALRMGSKVDEAVPYFAKASKEGQAAGLSGSTGVGANLPMLVLTSELRTAMNSRQHKVDLLTGGEVVRITFRGLPEHAKWLHEGTATMPARSPVTPNLADRTEVVAAMRRFLDRALGKGGGFVAGTQAEPSRTRIA